MRRLLNKLVSSFRNFRSTGTVRPACQPSCRASLRAEGLEDRMVLASASLVGSTLLVTADPGHFGIILPGHVIPAVVQQIRFEADALHPHKVDVSEGTTLLGQFPIAAIKNVEVNLKQLDAVTVDDSNGLPFAPAPGSGITVSLIGNGIGDSLNVTGSRTLGGSETYISGNGPLGAVLSVGGFNYDLSGINSVTDSVKTNTGVLSVFSDGTNVSLSGQNGATQTLSGLAANHGAGDSLTFSHKSAVFVDLLAPNTSVVLDATAPETREQSFTLQMDQFGANDQVFIQATPKAVTTNVTAEGIGDFVNLLSNLGPVAIRGNTTTHVNLGEAAPNGLDTLAGIKAKVSVSDVASLLLADSGNTATQENVTVTESTISGTGLFGNNAVKLTYSNATSVAFLTGQLQDTYKVKGSSDSASFSSFITIDDFSKQGLNAHVIVGSRTDLNLTLRNSFELPDAFLTITALDGGTFSSPHPHLPQGTEFVAFGGVQSSQVNYTDCAGVTLN
jgi:hypothetical protein